MPSSIFNIDYRKLVALLTPPALRKTRLLALLEALILPVRTSYGRFGNNRTSNLYKLAHNGQVCYLRKALNDRFDPSLRRIYIAEGNKYEREYIYTSAEQKPRYLGTMYLRQAGDYADTGVDFRVVVPLDYDLENNVYQIRALVDFYKLAGKRYQIEKDE